MCGCLSHASYWGPGPQSRHMLWLGIEPATLPLSHTSQGLTAYLIKQKFLWPLMSSPWNFYKELSVSPSLSSILLFSSSEMTLTKITNSLFPINVLTILILPDKAGHSFSDILCLWLPLTPLSHYNLLTPHPPGSGTSCSVPWWTFFFFCLTPSKVSVPQGLALGSSDCTLT